MQDDADWSEKNYYNETSYYKDLRVALKKMLTSFLGDYGVSKRRWGQITQMEGVHAVKGSKWDIAIRKELISGMDRFEKSSWEKRMFEGYTDAGFTCYNLMELVDMGHFPKETTENDLLEHDQESLRNMWVDKHLTLLLNQHDMNKQTEWGYVGEQDPPNWVPGAWSVHIKPVKTED